MSDPTEQPLGEVVPNTTPAPWPSKEIVLTGNYVTLVPLSPSHAGQLFPLIGGPSNTHLWAYMPYDPCPASPSALESDMVSKAAARDPTFYTILKHDTQGNKHAVGWGSYLRIDPKNRVIEVGHLMFSSQLQKSAAATEAMYLMAKYAFDLGYRRYEWKCHSLNAPSRRAALRYGFTEEGTFRQHLIDKHGRNRDTTWFSMLNSEWEGRKRAFEMWLDEGNFDGEGRQRKRLEEFRE